MTHTKQMYVVLTPTLTPIFKSLSNTKPILVDSDIKFGFTVQFVTVTIELP